MTAPGAPVTGLAVPLSTPPRPSPNHQTAADQATEPASATLTAGRQAMPRPRASWMVAKAAFVVTGLRSMMPAAQRTESATSAGLPSALPASIWPNARVNMNDWYCRTPSSTHRAARPSWSQRRRSGGAQAAARAAAAGAATGCAVTIELLGSGRC